MSRTISDSYVNPLYPELEEELARTAEEPAAFRSAVEYTECEGLEGLADKLVQGPGALTDAYSKAVRQVEEPQAQGKAPKLDAEQKKEFWANRESPVQGLGPRQ